MDTDVVRTDLTGLQHFVLIHQCLSSFFHSALWKNRLEGRCVETECCRPETSVRRVQLLSPYVNIHSAGHVKRTLVSRCRARLAAAAIATTATAVHVCRLDGQGSSRH